jgi:hypothetical protein
LIRAPAIRGEVPKPPVLGLEIRAEGVGFVTAAEKFFSVFDKLNVDDVEAAL